MTDLIGRDLGRYHILEQLGEGGMATVYKAYDTRLEADVAVKVIRTEALPQNAVERALKRFEREAKALARLTHANIVKVTDYGEYEGEPYLVMEYLPSGTLKEKLAGKRMEWQDAVRILLPVARALDYAHEQGMIHRDVKPSNILITYSGDPMLTDFGIAKIIDEEATMDLTGTSAAVGTPGYMAPEQVSSKTVDHRVDIYALAIVFYEMVTGRRPFQADTPLAVLVKHASEPLPRPRNFVPELPQEVENVLLKALAKQPEDRYEDMHCFAGAMEGLLSGKSKTAPTVLKKAQPEPKRQQLEDYQATRDALKPAPARLPVEDAVPQEKLGSKKQLSSRPALIGLAAMGVVAVAGLLILGGLMWQGQAEPLKPTTTNTHTTIPTKLPTSIITPSATILPTATLGIGSTWVRPQDGMEMVYVAAGPFSMGSEDGNSDEKPVHAVDIDAFWIDRTEITNEMYDKCAAVGSCSPQTYQEPGYQPEYLRNRLHKNYYGNPEFDLYPVIEVWWADAKAYCEWAGARLPTEAEWEKTARGTDGRTYPWGEDIDCSRANYGGCVGDTTAVGSYPGSASPYGALDMAGNVWEWVVDWYGSDYYSVSVADNPTGPLSGELNILRGGDWSNEEGYARSTNRQHVGAGGAWAYFIGFRCARSE